MRVFSLLRLRAGEFGDSDLDVAVHSNLLSAKTYQTPRSRRAATEGGKLSLWHFRMALWCVVYTTYNNVGL
jgi:hypothetical protein